MDSESQNNSLSLSLSLIKSQNKKLQVNINIGNCALGFNQLASIFSPLGRNHYYHQEDSYLNLCNRTQVDQGQYHHKSLDHKDHNSQATKIICTIKNFKIIVRSSSKSRAVPYTFVDIIYDIILWKFILINIVLTAFCNASHVSL